MNNASAAVRPKTYLNVLLILGVTHLLNDLIQSLIPAVYPILRDKYQLDFIQIGVITLTFQIAGSLLQPVVGAVTDRRPFPYSTVIGMLFTLSGLIGLAFAPTYHLILVSAASIGIGSSIFHPEATRMARYASGGRQGLAQGIFQVGGQAGGAMGPLFAALIIVQRGQQSLAWFGVLAVIAVGLMIWTARRHDVIKTSFIESAQVKSKSGHKVKTYPKAMVTTGLIVLTLLMFSKNAYVESFRSFYTFYLIDHFGASVRTSQFMLFLFLLSSAAGALLGGILGDRIGRYKIIWISILGPLPLTLILPYADFQWTAVLTVAINLIMASAFASILIYAMELAPNRIGLVGGLFYGLNFGLAGIAAAVLGALADKTGIENVYWLCSFLPLAGLLTWFLPKIENS
ncbi:MFS transporter [Pectobacterium sp. A5351]|uniref:MFS transporter n=1 Tax=Pectobacterium sp. A5351 TaxID=2914983 RepID=UPI00232E9E38|nr:MFS transporter [Pectobacterium sp. A5351]WCG84436.1 MFS transporter [Pectobacterium sp. A5351]